MKTFVMNQMFLTMNKPKESILSHCEETVAYRESLYYKLLPISPGFGGVGAYNQMCFFVYREMGI